MGYYNSKQILFFDSLMDLDALAFINAAGITDNTQKVAINTLVKSLKNAGLWTKMYAVYPIVGGTATTHKFNLKDPRDLDAAFRLVFSGTITHSSSGMVGNGSTGYANTKLTPSSTLSLNDTHASFYSRTSANDTTAFRDMGATSNSGANNITMLIRFNDNARTQVNANTLSASSNNVSGACHILMNRSSSTTQSSYRNGSLMADYTVTSTGLPTVPIFLFNQNNNGSPSAGLYSTRQCAFATIGQGLNSTEVSNLYTIIQSFQTTLGRQV